MVVAATACGGDEGGVPTLTWWINPDPNPPEGFEGAFGQAGIAERCSTDQYKIETELLPGSASEQRIQLARRLAAEDSSIDLMSLDPVFTAEFAEAEFLEPLPADLQERVSEGIAPRRHRRRERGTVSWWSPRSGRTRKSSGTASRSPRRPVWT